MATFTYEISKHRKRKDGTMGVAIRITHKRTIRRMNTGIYVSATDLTKSLKLKNQILIDQLTNMIRELRTQFNTLGIAAEQMSADEVVQYIKQAIEQKDGFKLDFLHFIEQQAATMAPGTGRNYITTLHAIKRFIKRDSLDISEITYTFLKKFEAFLENEPVLKPDKNGNLHEQTATKRGGRAISLYMACIRAMHNRAKEEYNDEDCGQINIPYSPFSRYKIQAPPPAQKRAIGIEQIQAIINLPEHNHTRFNLAKDCFLLSFALMGMNSADMFYCVPGKGGIITYNRRKTASRRQDKAEMQVKIPACIQPLIDKYRDKTGQHLFNFHLHYADELVFNRALNHGMKEVAQAIGLENLTFYYARHSMATIAYSAAVGIDKQIVHEMLNHVDKNMKVTDIYIDRDWSVLWQANEKVLKLFDWSPLQQIEKKA